MTKWNDLSDIRRDYGALSLDETQAQESPMAQFECWFEEVLRAEKNDPTAMVLSTVDKQGLPDSRIVLLKGIDNGGFVFYTNYLSTKGLQLKHTPFAALNFYWPQMARQVRVRGRVILTTTTQADDYFSSRPILSQLSAIASPQSREISDRAQLETSLNELIARHQQQLVMRPDNWGGYIVMPEEYEFWQGRDNRLHDRIHYSLHENVWTHRRLAP